MEGEGRGLTVMLKLKIEPTQPLAVGVRTITLVMGNDVPFEAVNGGIFPTPPDFKPMAVLLFVHVNVDPETGPVTIVPGTP